MHPLMKVVLPGETQALSQGWHRSTATVKTVTGERISSHASSHSNPLAMAARFAKNPPPPLAREARQSKSAAQLELNARERRAAKNDAGHALSRPWAAEDPLNRTTLGVEQWPSGAARAAASKLAEADEKVARRQRRAARKAQQSNTARWSHPDNAFEEGGTAMEYAFRSLDPRDVGAQDTLFYLGLADGETDVGQDKSFFNTPRAVYYCGYREGILYRQIILQTPPNNGSGYTIDLAEIPLPGGVLRIDRSRLAFEHELTLGHFGMPHIATETARVAQRQHQGCNLITSSIANRRLALVTVNGWDRVASKVHPGMNAEADESTVIYACRKRLEKNPAMELLVSVLLHQTADAEWTDEELFPIKHLDIRRIMPSGSVLGAYVTLHDGNRYTIDFDEIDAYRRC